MALGWVSLNSVKFPVRIHDEADVPNLKKAEGIVPNQ